MKPTLEASATMSAGWRAAPDPCRARATGAVMACLLEKGKSPTKQEEEGEDTGRGAGGGASKQDAKEK